MDGYRFNCVVVLRGSTVFYLLFTSSVPRNPSPGRVLFVESRFVDSTENVIPPVSVLTDMSADDRVTVEDVMSTPWRRSRRTQR